MANLKLMKVTSVESVKVNEGEGPLARYLFLESLNVAERYTHR